MENDLQVKYDSLCYTTFINVRHLTKDATRIALKNVDWSNKEHKFVLHIINACHGLLDNKEVAMELGPLTRSTIAHECGGLGKIRKINKVDTIFVDVPDLLEFMRGAACKLCGVEFTFGNIYDAYYSGKDE